MIEVDPPELVRARRSRFDEAVRSLGIDGWLLTTGRAVRFVTGVSADTLDLSGESTSPVVAVGDHVVAEALPPTDARLVDDVLDRLPSSGRIAVDRVGLAALSRLRELRPGLEVVDFSQLAARARNPKSAPEIETICRAVHLTEQALQATLPAVRAGRTERELNAEFYARAIDLGLDDLHVDTVFAALPKRSSDAPWVRGAWSSYHPYRELTSSRGVEEGDQLVFDAGLLLNGYASDVGWTVKVGADGPAEASPDERELASRWKEVAMRVVDAARPGASCRDLRRAALDGWPDREPPWPYPLYVAHGVGTEVAEPPFAGAEVTPETEEAMTIETGQVLLVEPYVWEEGVGGYRAEYCVVVEESGARVVNDLDFGSWPTPEDSR